MLKLKAQDVEDLQVISAVLQDAIVPVCDMTWRPEDKNFIMVVQRLCREAAPLAAGKLERVCCAVNVRGVEQVQDQRPRFQGSRTHARFIGRYAGRPNRYLYLRGRCRDPADAGKPCGLVNAGRGFRRSVACGLRTRATKKGVWG